MGAVKALLICDTCGQEGDNHMTYCKKIMDTPSTFKPESRMEEEDKLNDKWVGGSTNIRPAYYAKYKIDPWDFCIQNGVDLPTGSVIKYVMRHRDKNGVEDINKAIKCLEMIREHYYGEQS
jgi:hypothetical protein